MREVRPAVVCIPFSVTTGNAWGSTAWDVGIAPTLLEMAGETEIGSAMVHVKR